MKKWKIAATAGAGTILTAATLRNVYELHHLQITSYVLQSEKVRKENAMKLVFLSDLHCRTYGGNNRDLVKMVRDIHPDAILIGGDMLIGSRKSDDSVLEDLLPRLSEVADVFYASGNHELRVECDRAQKERWERLNRLCREHGITYLRNRDRILNEDIVLTGLNVEEKYYHKPIREKISAEDVRSYLGEKDDSRFHILLAHSPSFFDACAGYGCDLVLAGHYHGGAVRIPGIGGVISPQFQLFPKYSSGIFRKDKTTMIVTAGCGSHKVNLRLFNKPEVVVIDIRNKTDRI